MLNKKQRNCMMNMEEIRNKVDILLADKGLTKDGEEQAVHQLLFHLYTAIDTYRYMTQAEKNAAGRWYRTFKTSFTLRNFLKERKRHRERKNPPCTPLIRKGLLEKGSKISLSPKREAGVSMRTFRRWCKPFRKELIQMGWRPEMKLLPPKIVAFLADKLCIIVPNEA